MTERAYTVAEIDALRRACENKYLWGTYTLGNMTGTRMSRVSTEKERTATVEEWVRTHMFAGHTAEDLYASDQRD